MFNDIVLKISHARGQKVKKSSKCVTNQLCVKDVRLEWLVERCRVDNNCIFTLAVAILYSNIVI